MFHQIEGLVIDKGIHMGHLKWTLETFLARFFEDGCGDDALPATHFPFTEPSAEVDVQCDRSGGELRIGQGSDWLEILGSGMVHPNGASQRRARSPTSGRASPSVAASTASPC